MDRDLIWGALSTIWVGVTMLAAGAWYLDKPAMASARVWERALWRRLWYPAIPSVLVLPLLLGWALREPAQSDELLPTSAFLLMAAFSAIWARGLVRAGRSVRASRQPVVAGTLGLWKPRVVVSDELSETLDESGMRAVMAHELAHVRHRDPLRILLAQLVTDLQWPWPRARRRFQLWRHALELARDEEALDRGADGADLASAILCVARLSLPTAAGAALLNGPDGLADRIQRLLTPTVPPDAASTRPHALLLLTIGVVGSIAVVGLALGLEFGEGFVQALVRCFP